MLPSYMWIIMLPTNKENTEKMPTEVSPSRRRHFPFQLRRRFLRGDVLRLGASETQGPIRGGPPWRPFDDVPKMGREDFHLDLG